MAVKKVKLNEVAKALHMENKELIHLLDGENKEPKKATSILTEEELDLVLDKVTKAKSVENFDAYFVQLGNQEAPASTEKTGKSDNKGKQEKPSKQGEKKVQKSAPQAKKEDKAPVTDGPVKRHEGRIVDTRSSNVNIDRYNEKYDRLANEKIRTDNVVQKQKLTQKSSQYRNKPKHAKRETEAERLKRIQLERQKKQMTIQVPDEITVGELALRLKATAAEVIKKLMMLGVMATVNDVIDFDTASLIAMEFHAKVEKEVIVTIE